MLSENLASAEDRVNAIQSLMHIEVAVESTLFLQISVDGDTSTNDTVLGLASGKAGGSQISDPSSQECQQLESAVTALLQVQSPSVK